MKLIKKDIQVFQKTIFDWWKDNRRDLPWRRTRDPYKILVSEVMLQQTQVSRVLTKYAEFIEIFPTVSHLANAAVGDVLRVWKGMGYNRRALYLHKAAKVLYADFSGKFPISQQLLIKLPGVGTYTARAILVFAFKKHVAAVDTNIRQIILHYFFNDIPQSSRIIQEAADQLVPKGKSWEWHQALMDFGAIEISKFNRRSKRRDVSHGTSQARKVIIPFKDTKRFIRGRIIDKLREKDVSEKMLIAEISSNYNKPKDIVSLILKDLERDGLVTRHKGLVDLPK